MIRLLPHWVITNKNPAFYDSESVSAIEQTGRVYAKMQELIDDYNKFVDEVNAYIKEFTEDVNADQECFEQKIIETMENYIKSIDMKTDELEAYLKTNIVGTIKDIVASGELNEELKAIWKDFEDRISVVENTEYTLEHNPDTEEITLVKTVKGGTE